MSLPLSGPSRVAIIGAACRFPGAENLAAFRALLADAREAVSTIPAARQALARGAQRAGLLADVERFDPEFFGIAQREADQMDPQQRLLLELVVEALDAAGLPRKDLAGSRTGVYIGISTSDYSRLQVGGNGTLDLYSGTGNALSIAANRISYVLNLAGPSFALDTACSSSLNATHLAVRALRAGEIDLAIVGGVNLLLAGDLMEVFANARMLSPDGRCKTFDASADGYVRGEGGAIVLLKRAADAARDHHPVLALIAGSAANQDGRSNGLTAPSGPAQVAVIEAALADAGLQASDIDAVELHGTGTPLGDPIEAHALAQALRAKRASALLVGSVKTNIGHLESAAGIAGLLKAAVALDEGRLPASLNFQRVNPEIDLDALGLQVATATTPLSAQDRPAHIGVSSFGFGGSNAHVILEQVAAQPERDGHAVLDGAQTQIWSLPLSAAHPEALRELAARYADRIAGLASNELHDVCYSAARHRDHLDHRLFAQGDHASLVAALRAAAAGQTHDALWQGQRPAAGPRKLAILADDSALDDGRFALGMVLAAGAGKQAVSKLTGRWDLLLQAAEAPAGLPERIRVLHAREPAQALALLYVHGHDLRWERIYPQGQFTELPAYPWRRRRCWFAPLIAQEQPATATDSNAHNQHAYRIQWRELPKLDAQPVATTDAQRWLLVGGGELAEQLRTRIEADGEHVVTVGVGGNLATRKAAVAGALATQGPQWRTVLHLDALDNRSHDSAQSLFVSGLATVQALIESGQQPMRLWFATRASQAVVARATLDHPAQAVLHGIARTLANEAPHLLGGSIDLPGTADHGEASTLLYEAVRSPRAEQELASRDGAWWAPRLQRAPVAADIAVPPLDANGVYLITGAFGALGEHLLRWLVERGARRLALLGRRAPDAAALQRIEALRAQQVRVESFVCDVGDADALRAALVTAEKQLDGSLVGVIHAAGAFEGAFLAQMTEQQVAKVLSGKAEAALTLADALRGRDLPLFMLISSAAATFGLPGNGNYNAANAVLDAVAAHRRGQGHVALAVSPAPIVGIGMEATAPAALRAYWQRLGLQPLQVDGVLRQIEQVQDIHHLLALPVDWKEIARHVGDTPPPLLSELLEPVAAVSAKPVASDAARAPWRQWLIDAPTAQRTHLLEQRIGEILGRVLHLPSGERPDPVLGLQAQGMDSLMALEFHDNLQRASGLQLPSTLALETPSVRSLATRLLGLLLPATDTAHHAHGAKPASSAAVNAARASTLADKPVHELLSLIAGLDDAEAWQELITATGDA
ncbi:SDR family NAD(P)-dependent oxidoreductase [Paraburkholderia megapolitana]|uniref:SDR family NAD(P)-dependent oxidoreductase n=1 Tax=Paraburkholderia megapolitana TaxID=420953 RepID=UPI0038B86FC4